MARKESSPPIFIRLLPEQRRRFDLFVEQDKGGRSANALVSDLLDQRMAGNLMTSEEVIHLVDWEIDAVVRQYGFPRHIGDLRSGIVAAIDRGKEERKVKETPLDTSLGGQPEPEHLTREDVAGTETPVDSGPVAEPAVEAPESPLYTDPAVGEGDETPETPEGDGDGETPEAHTQDAANGTDAT